MLALLNSSNAHNFPIFQPILMILVPKFMVHRAPSDKTYLSLELLSPFKRLSLQLLSFFEIFYFLFKSFVKVELSYVFTINLITIAENCTEK